MEGFFILEYSMTLLQNKGWSNILYKQNVDILKLVTNINCEEFVGERILKNFIIHT